MKTMRTWAQAERVMRKEAGRAIGQRAADPAWFGVAVGTDRPIAVISLVGLDPDRPRRTLTELALLAAAFTPTRVLVGLATVFDDRPSRAMLAVHDATATPDGWVQRQIGWGCIRVGRHVVWAPGKVVRWQFDPQGVLSTTAELILTEASDGAAEFLPNLIARSKIAGHRILVAKR